MSKEFKLRILIAGGTGFIGKAFVNHRLKKGDSITVLGRNTGKIKSVFSTHPSINVMSWNDLNAEGSNALLNFDAVINLCGENIARFWSEKVKQRLINSRVIPTRTLATLCSQLGKNAPLLINANGIGIYGLQKTLPDDLPPPMDEDTPIVEKQKTDFLSTLGCEWENATNIAKNSGCRVVLARFGVVLGKDAVMLKGLRIPFLFGLGGSFGSGDQPFGWIALEDLLRALDFIIEHKSLSGPINLVSPNTVKQKEFAKAFAQTLHRPCFLKYPELILRLLLFNNQMLDEIILNGQHVIPKRLLESGFKFEYPDLQTALTHVASC